MASHRVVFIGLGTIAANLMIVIAWTGVIRGRFAGSAHPGIWRALHASAYLAWPFALVHGLESGRPAKTWVTVSYVACVVFVVLALLVRVCLTWGKRLRAPKATTSGTIRAVGKPVPRSEPPRLAPLPPPRPEPAPSRPEPAPSRLEPALHHSEPDMPVSDRYEEESGRYAARGPVSRGRLARAARAANAGPGAGVDLTGPVMPGDRIPEEPVTAPAAWRPQPAEDGSTGYSQKPPRLTFLDETPETPDQMPSGPSHARPANWDEPDPYPTHVSPVVGRHSGEYQVLQRTGGGYRPTRQAELEPAPARMYYDEADYRDPDPQPYAWTEEPVSVAPARRRRSHRGYEATVEVPPDPPATRKPAAVLTDEEFWAHMRGDALR